MYAYSVAFLLAGLFLATMGIGVGVGRLRPYRQDISAPARRRLASSVLFMAVTTIAAAVMFAFASRSTAWVAWSIGLALVALSVATFAFFVIRERP